MIAPGKKKVGGVAKPTAETAAAVSA